MSRTRGQLKRRLKRRQLQQALKYKNHKGIFLQRPSLTPCVGDCFIVDRPLRYKSISGEEFVVPRGFFTDLASTGKIFPSYIKFLASTSAAVLHDHCYANGLQRLKADQLYLEAMIADGTNISLALMYYRAVRSCGWRAYQKHKKAS